MSASVPPEDSRADPSADASSTAEDEVLAPGNPIRLRALPLILGGGLLSVVSMSAPVSPATMLVLGGFGALIATWGTLDLLGTFDDEALSTGAVVPERAWQKWGPPAALLVLSTLFLWQMISAAVAGSVGPIGAGVAVPLGMIAVIAAGFSTLERLGPMRTDAAGDPRPLWRRHGFWLLTLAIVIHVPLLGSHSLTDPWETHYGEVSREILARGDWITLWWAEDGWFQSKPVLTFWMQAASMALFGVRHAPGEMLAGIAAGHTPHPEWALRLPNMVMMLAGLYLLYRGVAETAGRRSALLGGVVLVTMPQFFFVARQAMTDMPFIAGMMACIGCALLASTKDPAARAPVHRVVLGPLQANVSLFHVVFGVTLAFVFMQASYLASRNLLITMEPYFDIRIVADSFAQGSPGNCGTPGNVKCLAGLAPTQDRLQPAVQALIWLQATALLLWLSWGERRLKRLIYLGAWLAAAFATMSKGIGGLAIPMTAVFLWVLATKRYRELTRMEIVGGLLLFAVVAVPWFAASYVRHGRVFVDRLFFDHMVKRTFGEMHQTNAGVDTSFRYYVWQLGYGTFPWVGLAPFAVVSWFRHRGERWSAACMMTATFLVGFVLFSLMGTRFHHYCAPLLPPLAMLIGILLDDMIDAAEDGGAWGAASIVAALITCIVGADLAWSGPGRTSALRLLHLFTYKYTRPWPEHLVFDTWLWGFTAATAAVLLALAVRRVRSKVVWLLVGCSALFAVWTVDVFMMRVAPHWGQRELLTQYEREASRDRGPLIAYQMNWKGENFYRGNRVPAFKITGAKFQAYVDDERRRGERTLYFLTEHKRVAALKSELGGPRNFDKLTDEKLNNKFTLLRVRYRPDRETR